MQKYPVRPDHRANLVAARLEEIARAEFGTAAREGESVVASFGALQRLSAGAAGRELQVDMTMDPKVPEAVASETIARYNRFLEAVTGYSSKERAKRLRKSASGG